MPRYTEADAREAIAKSKFMECGFATTWILPNRRKPQNAEEIRGALGDID